MDQVIHPNISPLNWVKSQGYKKIKVSNTKIKKNVKSTNLVNKVVD